MSAGQIWDLVLSYKKMTNAVHKIVWDIYCLPGDDELINLVCVAELVMDDLLRSELGKLNKTVELNLRVWFLLSVD